MSQELLSAIPKGPLDKYRMLASFDWKEMQLLLDTVEIINFRNEAYQEIKRNVMFQQKLAPSLNELRHISVKQMYPLRSIARDMNQFKSGPRKILAVTEIITSFNIGTALRTTIPYTFFPDTILLLGSEYHHFLVDESLKGQILGCFCLSEVGHGSNAKGIKTSAIYSMETSEFILHTNAFEDAKCWPGALGQIATHAVVFAQLTMSDGVRRGLHSFVVPIRNPNTLLPYPGVIVGDLGEKAGLNSVDNGFLMFNQYRIPRTYLLNKYADVNESGEYVMPFKSSVKKDQTLLGSLSTGRVYISQFCYVSLAKAITIAIRYAVVCKRYGPVGQDRLPVIEYKLYQYHLIPYLATTYCIKNFALYIMDIYLQIIASMSNGPNNQLMLEHHAISCGSKAVLSWVTRDGIQNCYEACGGHGFLKSAGLGDIKNDHDANLTLEGENYVIIQQTSNWLLKFWPLILKGKKLSSPMKSVDFLTNALEILNMKFSATTDDEVRSVNNIFGMYDWLVSYLLRATYNKIQTLIGNGSDSFTARNETQVFYAKDLAISYIERFVLYRMTISISEVENVPVKNVLSKLFSLCGLFLLQKHLPVFYQGGYVAGPHPTELVQDGIFKLIKDLKNEAVALIDVIAPPDFILNSVLGVSTGEVYQNLMSSIFHGPFNFVRPNWWPEVVDRPTFKSKL